jgi:hypothetical protein
MLLGKAVVMGVVEGLTEFLPVSSTGHLILAGSLLDFKGGSLTPEKVKAFEISIQTGAILAIVLVYWQRLTQVVKNFGQDRNARRFVLNVLIGFLPAVVVGLSFGKAVQAALFTPIVVASTFILGGLIILWAESRKHVVVRVAEVEDMRPLDALKIGLVQCLAFVPGYQPVGLDHHRRHAVWPVAQGGHRVHVFPGHPHADRRRRLQPAQGQAQPGGGRSSAVWRRLCVFVPGGLGLCALAVALRGHPQLQRLCLVPHRLWPADSGDRLFWHRQLGRQLSAAKPQPVSVG